MTALRILFIVMFTLLTCMRTWFKIHYGVFRDRALRSSEGLIPVILRWFLGIPLLLATAAYIISPAGYQWMYIRIPPFLRYMAVPAGFACVYLLLRVHLVLGDNLSTTLVPDKQHTLIRTGPYRYIRHPMYTAYFFLFVSAFIISGNWLIGCSGVSVIVTLMTLRLKKEEQLLLERYGHEYATYMKEVGRFVPRVQALFRMVFSRGG